VIITWTCEEVVNVSDYTDVEVIRHELM
jgi:hypothetical protein